MSEPDLIVVAQPVVADPLQTVRELVPGSRVEVIEPYGRDAMLAEDLATRCTILFADLPPANLDAMTGLRWMQLGSHGYGQLAGHRLPNGTVVTNASGVNDIPIAEWCVLMMLALIRRFDAMLAAQHEHAWDRRADFQAELRGKRVGIWGYGNIGRELTRLARALGLKVSALSRGGAGDRGLRYHGAGEAPEVPVLPDRVFRPGEEPEFLAELDFLVTTLPLTAQTSGLVDAAALGCLPRSAFVLNPARAGIIDEQALLRALRDGTIAGAALDDHYRTPMPDDDPFWDLPGTLVTAHISGSTASPYFLPRIWDLFSTNLQRFVAGLPLLNVIAREDLDLAPGSAGG